MNIKKTFSAILFVTLGASSTFSGETLKIFHLSDTHINNPESRSGRRLAQCIKVANEQKPDFFVVSGDLTNKAFDKSQNDAFKSVCAELDKNSKLLLLPGNHDLGEVEGGENMFTAIYGAHNFFEKKNGVAIIGFNSESIYNAAVFEKNFAWLKECLEKSSDCNSILVFGHNPLPNGKGKIAERSKKFLSLMKEYKVAAYFCGHLHKISEIFSHDAPPILACTAVSGDYHKENAGKNAGFFTIEIADGKITRNFVPLE